MGFQPGAVLNVQSFGTRPESIEVPHLDIRIPTITDVNYPVGKEWVYPGNSIWKLLNLNTFGGVLTATWVPIGGTTVTAGPGASPQVANGRSGSVTFSSVSIAAGATQAFVITNSYISPSSIVSVTMSGATALSSLSIQSVVNAAGQTTITVGNAVGATTSTANITFNYNILN